MSRIPIIRRIIASSARSRSSKTRAASIAARLAPGSAARTAASRCPCVAASIRGLVVGDRDARTRCRAPRTTCAGGRPPRPSPPRRARAPRTGPVEVLDRGAVDALVEEALAVGHVGVRGSCAPKPSTVPMRVSVDDHRLAHAPLEEVPRLRDVRVRRRPESSGTSSSSVPNCGRGALSCHASIAADAEPGAGRPVARRRRRSRRDSGGRRGRAARRSRSSRGARLPSRRLQIVPIRRTPPRGG